MFRSPSGTALSFTTRMLRMHCRPHEDTEHGWENGTDRVGREGEPVRVTVMFDVTAHTDATSEEPARMLPSVISNSQTSSATPHSFPSPRRRRCCEGNAEHHVEQHYAYRPMCSVAKQNQQPVPCGPHSIPLSPGFTQHFHHVRYHPVARTARSRQLGGGRRARRTEVNYDECQRDRRDLGPAPPRPGCLLRVTMVF